MGPAFFGPSPGEKNFRCRSKKIGPGVTLTISSTYRKSCYLKARALSVDPDPGPKLLDRMKLSYNLIIKKVLAKIALEMYQARY